MLFRRSDAELAGGDFDAAAATLDRVAGLPGNEWKRLFRLERRRGILDYRRDRYPEALTHFRAAQALADQHGDGVGQGQAANDVGNALRRIGDYAAALKAYLDSLEAKRRSGDPQLGPLLNNIGDLYRDLEEPDHAAQYYAQALAEHERAGRTLDVAHTLEAIGVLALDRGDVAAAQSALERAFSTFAKGEAVPDQLRVSAVLARAALASEAPQRAREWIEQGRALAHEHDLPLAADFTLQDARTTAALGDRAAARDRLQAAIRALPADSIDRIGLLEELAHVQAALGDHAGAYATLAEFHAAATKHRDAEHDQHLNQLRVRFDVAEKDRAIRLLAAENRTRALEVERRTMQLELSLASALFVIAALALLFTRRQQRARVAAAAERARLDAEIAQYRSAAADLALDRRRLQAALDGSPDAVLVLEGGDRIAAMNAAAAAWLGADATSQHDDALAPRLPALGAALAALDETGQPQAFAAPGVRARLAGLDAGLALLTLTPDDAAPSSAGAAALERYAAGIAAAAAQDAVIAATGAAADAPSAAEDAAPPAGDDFRRSLVELMLAAVATWERSTGTNRIELADKSRLWRITIDEGRLRVRAMERYLSLAKLPRLPRWREVLRTAYYVLAECPLEAAERADLKQRVETLQAAVRRRAVG